jgi:hypothetical protein
MKDKIYNILRSAIQNSNKVSNDGIEYEKDSEDEMILMNDIPIILDPEEYKDAFSTGNPGGDRRPLWRFSVLVDPIPEYADFYRPSNQSTEQVYESIINGATTDGPNDYATNVIAEAKRVYEMCKEPALDQSMIYWQPVHAVPSDWYEAKAINFNEIIIDLNTLTDEEDALEWEIVKDDDSVEKIALDSSSNMLDATMDIQMVSLQRPWLNPLIFDMDGWYLNGQREGFCSSGQGDGEGVIPIIPSSVIIGTPARINAKWSTKDQQIIDNARDNNHQLTLGPLLLNSGQNSAIYVVGWTISSVPFSPKLAKQETGSVFVQNSGANVAKFSICFQQNGKLVSRFSGNFEAPETKLLKMPGDATEIKVNIEVMTRKIPETWSNVKSLEFERTIDICYELTGNTLNPRITQISC